MLLYTCMSNQQIVSRQIRPILKRHGVLRAAFFGSFARGTAHRSSDIDLLVAFKRKKSLFDLVGLKLDLEDRIHRKVDLVTENSLHPRIAKNIRQDLASVI